MDISVVIGLKREYVLKDRILEYYTDHYIFNSKQFVEKTIFIGIKNKFHPIRGKVLQ